jgi:PhnB protein
MAQVESYRPTKGQSIMKTAKPCLNFNGNTEEAFTFYKSVFGEEFLALIRFKD